MPVNDLPHPNSLGPDPEPPGARLPGPRRVLIAGGGPAAVEAALALRAFGGVRLDVELLAPGDEYVHRPLAVTEPFAAGRARPYSFDALRELGIHVRRGALARVDAAAREVHTAAGERLRYDELLVATGAQALPAPGHAVTFTGSPEAVEAVHGIVQDLEGGWSTRIAFVVPRGAGWALPIYELALQMAERAEQAAITADLSIFTVEQDPLQAFGPTVSRALRDRLAGAGVRLATGVEAVAGRYDRVIALPVLSGRRIEGLPHDEGGFLPVDEHARVHGLEHVYAAGDGTDFPVKQGGLATQQAEAAAEAIAVACGLRTVAAPFRGVLRALLITGDRPVYLRRRLDEPDGEVSARTLWWPPGKIAGQRLAPFIDSLDTVESVERALDRRAGRIRRRVAVLGR